MIDPRNSLPAAAYELLFRAYGSQEWWPADSPFEVMVGAILTQHTSWENVERALARLKASGSFSCRGLIGLPLDALEEYLRPSGAYRVKARRLTAYLMFFQETYGGSVDSMRRTSGTDLRSKLLSVSGIGPETADCILLYAMDKPWFVIDAYTRRIFGRLGWVDPQANYEDLQAWFQNAPMPGGLTDRVVYYNEYHALVVELGKRVCRPKPDCAACALNAICATGKTAS